MIMKNYLWHSSLIRLVTSLSRRAAATVSTSRTRWGECSEWVREEQWTSHVWHVVTRSLSTRGTSRATCPGHVRSWPPAPACSPGTQCSASWGPAPVTAAGTCARWATRSTPTPWSTCWRWPAPSVSTCSPPPRSPTVETPQSSTAPWMASPWSTSTGWRMVRSCCRARGLTQAQELSPSEEWEWKIKVIHLCCAN